MTGLPPDSWAVDVEAATARELVPGLWRLRLPLPWHHVNHANAYAVEHADGGIVLVDCGSGGHGSALAALERALGQAGFGVTDVRDLVITHYHTDHMGLVGPIKRASGCTVWGHPACSAHFDVVERPGATQIARHRAAAADGARDDVLAAVACVREELEGAHAPVRPDRPLGPGVVVETALGGWRVIEAPGHCPSQVCLYQRERGLLFSADLLMPEFTTYCDVGFAADPIGDFRVAIERIAALGSPTCLGGHGRPLDDLPALVDRYRAGIAGRLGAVEAALGDRPVDGATVARTVFGDIGYVTTAAWRFLEAQVYLAHLAALGRARHGDGGWASTRPEHDLAEDLAVHHPADALTGVGELEGRVQHGIEAR
jgi:glyoxylase-like metal-dependent hydrolase (beta-lactamase superfamily II)